MLSFGQVSRFWLCIQMLVCVHVDVYCRLHTADRVTVCFEVPASAEMNGLFCPPPPFCVCVCGK